VRRPVYIAWNDNAVLRGKNAGRAGNDHLIAHISTKSELAASMFHADCRDAIERQTAAVRIYPSARCMVKEEISRHKGMMATEAKRPKRKRRRTTWFTNRANVVVVQVAGGAVDGAQLGESVALAAVRRTLHCRLT
jgi:hypothetical protein